MFGLFKKKETDYSFEYLGLNPNIKIYDIGIKQVFELQEMLSAKVYKSEDIEKLKQGLIDYKIDLDKDLVFNSNLPKEQKKISVGAGSGLLVKDVTKYINPQKEISQKEIENAFIELKSKGIIKGGTEYKNITKEFYDIGIVIIQQFEFYNVEFVSINGVEYCTLKDTFTTNFKE